MTIALAGLLALRIPASITAHAAHPSTLLLALAWIGAIYVALALAVALLLVVSELMALVRGWRERRAVPIDPSSARCTNRNRVTAEPDPIESYPDAPIGFGFSELAPPIAAPLPVIAPIVVEPRVTTTVVGRYGPVLVPFNPFANSDASMRNLT